MSIAVLAGLGNPGDRYRDTRHNVGFAVLDRLATAASLAWSAAPRFEARTATGMIGAGRVLLVKPSTFVNASGRAVGAILRYRGIEASRLCVIHDDINLAPFRTKLSFGGGAGGHNGLADLIAQVGAGFFRYRIGIGTKPHAEMDLADFVLQRFSLAEKEELDRRMPDLLREIGLLLEKGGDLAMNEINQRPSTSHD